MWRQDGLCRIQAELGHDALCQVCQQFPRLRHDYGDFVELGLELSCPEAARLILSQNHTFSVEEISGGEAPGYDQELMSILQKSRAEATAFLDASPVSPNLTLAVLLLYTHEVQGWIDGGDAAELDVDSCLALARKYAANCDWAQFTDFFGDLEVLTTQWQARLATPAASMQWHSGFTTLAKYFIHRYWFQAVSDYDLISRVKFLISACLLVCHLGGEFVETAQLFSKEIENDPDNLEAILDGAYTSPALTDIHLLSLLLNG